MTHLSRSFAALFCLLSAEAFASADSKPIQVNVYDQIVAKVNSESISKRDVEERMGGFAERMYLMRAEKVKQGQWSKDADTEWTKIYVEAFRPALQSAVRDRLKLQHFELEKMSVDEKNFQKTYHKELDYLRSTGNKTFNPGDVAKRVREYMKIEEFGVKFSNATELPRRQEVEKFYEENKDRYKRKAGVKVRVIRIDQTIVNKLNGAKSVRENPYQMLEEIRRDIVQFGALFAEVAKAKTDDADLRDSGGLCVNADKDPYIVPEEYNRTLASEIRELKVGDVSRIFSYGPGYAIAMVEERREEGFKPLEGKLYDEIYVLVRGQKSKKKEDEWFRATLAKSLILRVVEGNAKPMPIDFFFPDDKKPGEGGADIVRKN